MSEWVGGWVGESAAVSASTPRDRKPLSVMIKTQEESSLFGVIPLHHLDEAPVAYAGTRHQHSTYLQGLFSPPPPGGGVGIKALAVKKDCWLEMLTNHHPSSLSKIPSSREGQEGGGGSMGREKKLLAPSWLRGWTPLLSRGGRLPEKPCLQIHKKESPCLPNLIFTKIYSCTVFMEQFFSLELHWTFGYRPNVPIQKKVHRCAHSTGGGFVFGWLPFSRIGFPST